MFTAWIILGVVVFLVLVAATMDPLSPPAPATLCWCGHAYGAHARRFASTALACRQGWCACRQFAPARPPGDPPA